MKKPSRTIEQRPDSSGFAKAGELIEITGIGHLTLQDRRAFPDPLRYGFPPALRGWK
jgi:hypothetical protein